MRFAVDSTWWRASFALVLAGAFSCSGDFDASRRKSAPTTTLGADVFGALCDRLGASVLAEDLAGDSYRAVCHPAADGSYAERADETQLPSIPAAAGVALDARRRALAKLAAMARRRTSLVAAIDAILPDVTIADPRAPNDAGARVRLHDALVDLTHRIVPLYDANPFSGRAGAAPADAEPLVPAATRAAGRLFDAIAASPDAQAALSQMSGRLGYRPLRSGLGAVRPALAYPRLRPLARAALDLFGPGRPAAGELANLLEVTRAELSSARADSPTDAFAIVDASRAQPNRPRTDLELLQRLLLAEDERFARGGASRPIVARDARGYVRVAGAAGVPGAPVPSPFVDLTGSGPSGQPDGLPDVDAFGRFVDVAGAPLAVDSPFALPDGRRVRPPDALGRAVGVDGAPLYAYVDTSRTLAGALAADLAPLVDSSPAGDHETVMNALAGALVLYGDRVDARRTSPYEISYRGFAPETSPLVGIWHAVGQVVGDPESDDLLLGVRALVADHEGDLARLWRDSSSIYADANDTSDAVKLAARVPPTSLIWDDMASVVDRMIRDYPRGSSSESGRSLVEDLVLALADDDTLALGKAYESFLLHRDRISYDPDDLNGPALDLDTRDHGDPSVLAERDANAPTDSPGNQSDFQRFVRLIHDADGVVACNKEGAVVHAKLGPLPVRWPLVGSIGACKLLRIENLATFYVDVIAGTGTITIEDTTLNGLLSFGGSLGLTSVDDVLSTSSGIAGLGARPTPAAVNRFVFFGSEAPAYGTPPDLDPRFDGANQTTNVFLRDVLDPLPTALCPVTDPARGLRTCATFGDTLRGRDADVIFAWEKLDFYRGMRPMLRAFAAHHAESSFVDLVHVLHRHWASSAHGPECDPAASATSAAYCTEDGAVSYETIVASAFGSDLLPALHDFARTLVATTIRSERVRPGESVDGVELVSRLTTKLFSTDAAARLGMKDRAGNASTPLADGTTQKAQLTPFDLFGRALAAMDARFVVAPGYGDLGDRKSRWRKARGQLVDQFLAVDAGSSGAGATFHDRAVPGAMLALVDVLREQVDAHCAQRESGAACAWATRDLADGFADSLGGPTFAAIVDLAEKLRADDAARVELEKFLEYLLATSSDADALESTLATLSDLLQILRDDGRIAKLMAAVSTAAAPDGATSGDGRPVPGLATTALHVLDVLTDADDTYDRWHVVDAILPRLVTPMSGSESYTPLEVFVDTIAEVQRVDADSSERVLASEDYRAIAAEMRDFLASPTRGLEQFYTVINGRDGR